MSTGNKTPQKEQAAILLKATMFDLMQAKSQLEQQAQALQEQISQQMQELQRMRCS